MNLQNVQGGLSVGGAKGQVGRLSLFNKIKQFFHDVVEELKKVSWTTRQELIDATIVVVISIFVLAAIIGVIDYGLTIVLDKLIR